MRAGMARRPRSLKSFHFSAPSRLCATRTSLLFRRSHMFTRQMRMVVTIPGTTVERKQASTDCPLIQAKMIRVALGGIRSPRREAFAISAAACPRG